MLLKLIGVLFIVLLLNSRTLPPNTHKFKTVLEDNLTKEECIIQGLQLERQIILWRKNHGVLPPVQGNNTLGEKTLEQMGIDTILKSNITYIPEQSGKAFSLQLKTLTNSKEYVWQSPYSHTTLP